MKAALFLLFIAAITALQNVEAQTAGADSAETIQAAKSNAHRLS